MSDVTDGTAAAEIDLDAERESDDFFRALVLLDGAQAALDEAARREKAREAGKPMRCITHQQRAAAAKTFVDAMFEKYGIDLG